MRTTATKASRAGLDLKAVEGIIELCVRFGVSRVKFRDLELEFQKPGPESLGHVTHQPQIEKFPVKEITDDERRAFNKAGLEEDELSLREQQIAELQLTDPSAAEEMIVSGELDDTADGDADGANE